MFGSDILDVVIGVIFVFLALSLAASAGAEIVERFLKKRAADLEKGIGELVADRDNKNGFLARVYNHPLVNGLFEGKYEECKKKLLPSYIPARNFALALIDLDRQAFANPPTVVLPENVKTALRTLQIAAGDDIAALQKGIENWYDSSMDRVSGWYKRRAQLRTFLLGLSIAILVNADIVEITRRVSNDQAVRKGLVAAAEATAAKPPEPGQSPEQVVQAQVNRLSSLGLPVGVYAGWPPALTRADSFGAWLNQWRQFFLLHWLGWIMTGVAVSFGAPFWFDMLNKVTVIRSTVKPHEKSPEEKSHD